MNLDFFYNKLENLQNYVLFTNLTTKKIYLKSLSEKVGCTAEWTNPFHSLIISKISLPEHISEVENWWRKKNILNFLCPFVTACVRVCGIGSKSEVAKNALRLFSFARVTFWVSNSGRPTVPGTIVLF